MTINRVRRALLTLPFVFSVLPAHAAETLSIGAVLPLTGPASEVGNDQRRGIELAVDYAKEHKMLGDLDVQAVVEDNQAKPDVSVTAFNKLVRFDKAPAIITGYSGPTLAMVPLATRTKTLLLNGGAQNDALTNASPFLINTVPAADTEVSAMAKYVITEKGAKTAAIVYSNDAQGKGVHDSFVRAFEANGGKMVVDEAVATGESNFRAPLVKIAGAKPDVLFAVMSQNYTQLSEQAQQLGVKTIMTGNTSVNQVSNLESPLMQGWYHTQLRLDATKDIMDAYQKKYGKPMGFYARQYYNTTYILLQAMAKTLEAKKDLTGGNIRDTILSIKDFKSTSGTVSFPTNTVKMPIDIRMISDHQDVFVKSVTE